MFPSLRQLYARIVRFDHPAIVEIAESSSRLNIRESLRRDSQPKPGDSALFRLTLLRNALEADGGSQTGETSLQEPVQPTEGVSLEKGIQAGDG